MSGPVGDVYFIPAVCRKLGGILHARLTILFPFLVFQHIKKGIFLKSAEILFSHSITPSQYLDSEA